MKKVIFVNCAAGSFIKDVAILIEDTPGQVGKTVSSTLRGRSI